MSKPALHFTHANGIPSGSYQKFFQFLNKDSLVWVNPFKHFGRAWGEVKDDKKIKIVAEQKGVYNILVFGDRKDEAAMKDFNKYGIEYKIKK